MLDSFKPAGAGRMILVIINHSDPMIIVSFVLIAAALQQARQVTPPRPLHEYTVDAGHSPVEFSIGFGLAHVKGRFTQWRGTILYDSINPGNSSITGIFGQAPPNGR